VSDPSQKEGLEKIVSTGNYTFKWFPTPLENCTQGYKQKPDNCALNMYNWSALPIVNIMGKEFYVGSEEIGDLFENYVNTIPPDDYTSFLEDANTNHIYLLQNPEVPVTVIYDGHLKTEQSFTWNYDPTDKTSKDSFALPNVTTYTQGDGTVPVTSALLPGIKWSWEYENKDSGNITNPHPVKIVEFCSTYNNKPSIYDNLGGNDTHRITKNEYIGMSCDCNSGTDSKPIDGDDCNHSVAVSDSNFVRLLADISFTNQRISDVENTGAYLLSESELKKVSQTCPAMNLGNTLYFDLVTNLIVA